MQVALFVRPRWWDWPVAVLWLGADRQPRRRHGAAARRGAGAGRLRTLRRVPASAAHGPGANQQSGSQGCSERPVVVAVAAGSSIPTANIRVMQRLSQASEPAKPAQSRPPPLRRKPAREKKAPVAEKAPEKSGQGGKGADWLTRLEREVPDADAQTRRARRPARCQGGSREASHDPAGAGRSRSRRSRRSRCRVRRRPPSHPPQRSPGSAAEKSKVAERHPRPRRSAGSPKPAAPMRPSAPRRSASRGGHEGRAGQEGRRVQEGRRGG